MMMLRRVGIALGLLMTVALAVPASENTPETERDTDPERRIRAPERIGVVFNTSSILLELEEYQGAGIGLKGVWEHFAGRALIGFRHSTSNETTLLNLGVAFEYHLAPGTVSPYAGAELALRYERNTRVSPSQRSIATGPAMLFGVEVAPLDILSLFAEYRLGLTVSYAEAGDDSTTNYAFGTGLGNQGAIGLIVYFLDRRER